MKRAILIVHLLLAGPLVSVADDTVYESLYGVKIGRVFLSQDQREILDARRLSGPPTAAKGTTTSSAAGAQSRDVAAAGYIVGRNGRSKIWSGGDFVEAGKASPRSMTFPGDVKITRHVVAESSDDAADPSPDTDEHDRERGDD